MGMTQPHFLVLWLQASHLSSSSLTGFGHPIQKRRVCLVEEDAWVEPWKNKRQSRVELNAFQTNAALTKAAFSSCRVRAIRYSRQTASTAVDKPGAMEWFSAGPGWGRARGPLRGSPHGAPTAAPRPAPAGRRRDRALRGGERAALARSEPSPRVLHPPSPRSCSGMCWGVNYNANSDGGLRCSAAGGRFSGSSPFGDSNVDLMRRQLAKTSQINPRVNDD